MRPESDAAVDFSVLDRLGRPVHASKLFHSGDHPTLRLRTREGYEVTGTHNHPLLCLVDMAGVPLLLWKLLEEIQPGDRVLVSRTPRPVETALSEADRDTALLLGAFVAEGFASENRAGFQQHRPRLLHFRSHRVRRGCRWPPLRLRADNCLRQPAARARRSEPRRVEGSRRWSHSSVSMRATRRSPNGSGERLRPRSASSCKRSSPAMALRRCCPARRSRSRTRPTAISSPRTCSSSCSSSASSAVCAGTRRARSRSSLTNRRDARLFSRNVGFLGAKQAKLDRELAQVPLASRALAERSRPVRRELHPLRLRFALG